MNYYLFDIITNFWGRFPLLDFLFIFLAKYFGYILVIMFLLLFFRNNNKKEIFYKVFLSTILARFVIVPIIRLFYYQERPFIEYGFTPLIEYPNINSFPSGHATFFFAFAIAIFLINKKMGIFFLISAFLISISRVYVGVHYLTDIIFGSLIGIFSAILVYKLNIVNLLKNRNFKKDF